MRIALVAPPWYTVPPRAYGGTEAIVAGLAEGLHAHGHDVLLIAAGPAGTSAPTVSTLPEPADDCLGDEAIAQIHALRAERAIADFRPELVHDHTLTGPSFAPYRPCPTVVTVHGQVSGNKYGELLALQQQHVLPVAISRAHRASAPEVPWFGTVHNGIPVARFPYSDKKSDDLVFLGRMHPDKGVVEAIEIAERTGRALRIAARLHGAEEEEYFASVVRPRLSSTIEFIGELGFTEKTRLLASSRALLFPLQWEEPYGLVVAEAQACGTPVLSLRRGAIPELVVEGRTAFLGDDAEDLVPAVDRVSVLRPRHCRIHAEAELDMATTVRGYERVYEAALSRTQPRRLVPSAPTKSVTLPTAPLITEGVVSVAEPTPTTGAATRRTS